MNAPAKQEGSANERQGTLGESWRWPTQPRELNRERQSVEFYETDCLFRGAKLITTRRGGMFNHEITDQPRFFPLVTHQGIELREKRSFPCARNCPLIRSQV